MPSTSAVTNRSRSPVCAAKELCRSTASSRASTTAVSVGSATAASRKALSTANAALIACRPLPWTSAMKTRVPYGEETTS